MKRFYLSKLIILMLMLSGFTWNATGQTTTFSYTGSLQTYVVPAGVSALIIDMTGGRGGNSYGSYGLGAYGGRVQCTLAATPGTTLNVYVAGTGNQATGGGSAAAGYNGGGLGGPYGGGGGGASDIRVGGTALTNRVVVAGGGGGGSWNCSSETGGAGGGLIGGNGVTCGSNSTSQNGQGGTQTAGGAGATFSGAIGGSLGQGGPYCCGTWGSAAGGGYYGGGGGYYGSGGGGSSYTDVTLASGVTHTQAYNPGFFTGVVKITPLVASSYASPTALAFSPTVVGSASAPLTFVASGVSLSPLTVSLLVTAPTGFEVSMDGITYGPTASLPAAVGGSLAATTVYVRFIPTTYSAYSGNVTISGGGISVPATVNVTGTGVFPCTGAPTAGTTAATPTTGGPSTAFALSLTGTAGGGGLAYQWQKSSYSGFGFADIAGATNPNYNFTGITADGYYRAIVTCPGSGLTSNSVPVFLSAVLPASSCIPTCNYTTSICGTGFFVATPGFPFTLTGDGGTNINDATACQTGNGGSPVYYDQTATMGVTLSMGGVYTTATMSNTTTNQRSCQIWIDFNNSGTFEASESVGGTIHTSGVRMNPTLTIPSVGVSPGNYRMRVTVQYDGGNGPGASANYPAYPQCNPCPTTTVYYAEVRDYKLTLQGPACLGTPTPGTITADVANGCASPYTSNLLYTPADAASGYTYKWQTSTDDITYTNITGATNRYYAAPITTSRYLRTLVGCGISTVTTTGVSLQLNPIPTVTGSANVCMPNTTVLTGSPAGGTWITTTPSLTTVGLGTGVVTGLAAGAASIVYTAPTGCTKVVPLGVNSAPAAISGSTNVCVGGTTSLSDSYTGGVWTSTDASKAAVNSTTGLVSGVATGGTPAVVYTLPTGCSVTAPITVNPLPSSITGTTNACVGATSNLSNASAGGTWGSSTFNASVGATTGVVTGMTAGPTSIVYTLPTGCSVSTPFTVNALPAAISGASNICVGATTTLTGAGGGTWSSSDASVANIASGTGVVNGVAAGTANMKYTLTATGCSVASPITVNILPAAFSVTGGGNYCTGGAGVHVGLNNSTNGVDYELFNGTTSIGVLPGSSSALDFGLQTGLGGYTIQATNSTTGCTQTMTGSVSVGVNSLPTVYTVGGGGNYCPGTSGSMVTLSSSDAGVNYQLFNGSYPVGSAVAGTGTLLNMGMETMPASYTVVATNASTLCVENMAGSTSVGISTTPSVYSMMGGGNYCFGSGGSDVMLNTSDFGVDYQLYNGVTAVGAPMPGNGGMLDFGFQTAVGTYTVKANDASTTCNSNMNGTAVVTVSPLPTVYTVTGGGNYCAGGAGVHVGLNYSSIGTNYQLIVGGTPGPIVAGSNSGLDFGIQSTTASYTVLATIAATGCNNNMTGAVSVGVNPLPNPYTVTGGGVYCSGSGGLHVGLGGSDGGINYQLYRDGVALGVPQTGTGASIDFGAQVGGGSYTVNATDASTSCMSGMPGSTSIIVAPLPTVYNVYGGGNFCSGGAGAHIMLSGSQIGVDYMAYLGGSPAGAPVAGTGGILDLGAYTTGGTYTIMATSASAGCQRLMNSSAVIGVNPLPAAYTVTGGGNYCAGGAGQHVYLSVSNTGVKYQLKNGGSPVGVAMDGTGFRLDFGAFTTPGTYTIEATNVATTCTNMMTGSANIGINLPPTVYTATAGGSYCAGGAGFAVGISGSDASVDYTLHRGTTTVAMLTGINAPLDFGLQTTPGTYTITAVDAITGCTSTMASSSVISVNPLPTPQSVTGGGNYCAGGTGVHVGVAGSAVGVDYELLLGGVPTGTIVSGTGSAIDFGVLTAGSYTAIATNTVTTCSNAMTGTAVATSIAPLAPMVTIASRSGDVACTGSSISYTATTTDAGTAPVYSWSVNGGTPVSVASAYSFIPANGDVVSLTVTSSAMCASPMTATATHTVTVNAPTTPAITIATTGGAATKVCAGTQVTMSSTPTNGGTAPSYSWRRNGFGAGVGSSFTFTPADGDVIFCVLNSNSDCRSADFAYSNNITFAVDQATAPSFNLVADPGTDIGKYQGVLFTADAMFVQGTNLTYQWKLNNNNVAGATNSSYSPTALINNNDVISCVVTGNNACGPHSTTKNVTMNVNSLGLQPVVTVNSDIRVVPNPNKGTFTVKGSLATTADETVTLEVTNMLGQVVYSQKVVALNGNIDEKVQLSSSLANGMYLLNVRSASDSKPFHFVIGQ